MLSDLKNKVRSKLVVPALSVCLMAHNSCVRYSATTYEAIALESKSYSPSVRVHHNNGKNYDMQVLKISEKSISGYSTANGGYEKVNFPISTISSFSQKSQTKFGVLSTKVGQGALIGAVVILAVYLYVNDDDKDSSWLSQ